MCEPSLPSPSNPIVLPASAMPTGTPSWNFPARMLASPTAIHRAAEISRPRASSAVAASLFCPPVVLHTTTPRAVQAAVSSEALRAPVIPSMRSFGSRLISDAGSGGRSRIDSTTSKSASWRAASSSLSNALPKNTTSARFSNGDQSALVFATPCQSSSTATLVMSDHALLFQFHYLIRRQPQPSAVHFLIVLPDRRARQSPHLVRPMQTQRRRRHHDGTQFRM